MYQIPFIQSRLQALSGPKSVIFLLLFLFLCPSLQAQEPRNAVQQMRNVDYRGLRNSNELFLGYPSETAWKSANLVSNAPVKQLKIHQPVKYGHLDLYLITGKTSSSHIKSLKTLKESLADKTGVVKETGDVNQLAVQNKSKKLDLFINAGDIVKGGKQDRTLAYDLWVPSNTEAALPSFCVEHDRWSKRGNEEVASFASNSYLLSSRSLRIASTVNNTQGEVWKEVSKLQEKLNSKLDTEVYGAASASSLQLSLENEELQEKIKEYEKAFASFGKDKEAIGFVFAINGELFGADYYIDPALFSRMREKLLTAAIVEAVSEQATDQETKTLTSSQVQAALQKMTDLQEGQYLSYNQHNTTIKLEDNEGYLLESRINPKSGVQANETEILLKDFDPANWLHRSFIFKPVEAE